MDVAVVLAPVAVVELDVAEIDLVFEDRVSVARVWHLRHVKVLLVLHLLIGAVLEVPAEPPQIASVNKQFDEWTDEVAQHIQTLGPEG